MKKVLLLIFLLPVFLEAQITFQKTYGGTGQDDAMSMQETNDGYILVGNTSSFGAGDYDVCLVKTDKKGTLLWAKTFGGSKTDYGWCIQKTSDAGFIIAGRTNSFGLGGFDVLVIKIDSSGNLTWSNTYGGTGDDTGYAIQQTNDDGFIIVGSTTSYGSSSYGNNLYLIKITSNGSVQWTKVFDNMIGNSIQQTNDGGYIIGTSSAGIIKTNSTGSPTWSLSYSNKGSIVRQTNDGGYIITGALFGGIGVENIYLFKTDSNGNILWSKVYGANNGTLGDWGCSVEETIDGGYIVGGYVSNGNGNYDTYLLKTNSNGDTTWTKTYGINAIQKYDYGRSALQTQDGGFIIAGNTISFNFPDDFYLIKTDSLGNSGCYEPSFITTVQSFSTTISTPTIQVSSGGMTNIPALQISNGGTETTHCLTIGINNFQKEKFSIQISPNPFTTSATVSVSGLEFPVSSCQFKLYDVFGREVRSLKPETDIWKLERGNLASGIYFYRLSLSPSPNGEGRGEVATGKLVVD